MAQGLPAYRDFMEPGYRRSEAPYGRIFVMKKQTPFGIQQKQKIFTLYTSENSASFAMNNW